MSRLIVAVAAAIPIFVIGIVYMSLLKADNPGRLYFERPIWKGQVQRGEWASFIISTPVMFYAAGVSWNGIILSYACLSFGDYPGLPSEIATGTLGPLETRKWSIMGISFSSFWEYEFTREFFVDLTNLMKCTHAPKVSLGASVAYFSSIAELAISASRDPNDTVVTSQSTTYFDSVVFLTMFLLIGTWIHVVFFLGEC